MKRLVLYHAGCADGFAAAMVARAALELPDLEAPANFPELRPVQYGDPIPDAEDVADAEVWVVDFSWPMAELEELARRARAVTVFDHHKSAAHLADIPTPTAIRRAGLAAEVPYLAAVFDPNRSGARIVWDVAIEHGLLNDEFLDLFAWVVDYTEDRDLWRWKLKDSREVSAAIQTLETHPQRGISQWIGLASDGKRAAARAGRWIERYRRREINAAKARACVRVVQLAAGRYEVPVVNVSGRILSEVVGELAVGHAFAAGWHAREDGQVIVNLRAAAGTSIDVGAIAKLQGGGGHPGAAGFTLPSITEARDLLGYGIPVAEFAS